MLLMISPAKKLEMEAPAPCAVHTQAGLLPRAAELVGLMRGKTANDLAALMGISGKLAELNERRFKAWQQPFDLANAKQALFAFRGDVYASLDADSLDEGGIAYAQQHLRILSGLYGVLRPLDLMQAYRLEMGTRLAGAHGRDLYAYWGDTITKAIAGQLDGQAEKSLVNLASGEYARAVDLSAMPGRVVQIHFKEEKDGVLRTIGIHAKRARGMMCRFAIDRRAARPEDLQDFDLGGYAWRPELSSNTDWVFAR